MQDPPCLKWASRTTALLFVADVAVKTCLFICAAHASFVGEIKTQYPQISVKRKGNKKKGNKMHGQDETNVDNNGQIMLADQWT